MRHGETVANSEDKMCGWYNSPLTEKGRTIAAVTGKGMKKAGIKFDCAFTSPLDRAKETCSIILKESGNERTPVYINENIKEINAGIWENQYKPTSGKETIIDSRLFDIYSDNPLNLGVFPGGESVIHSIERSQNELKRIAKLNYESVLLSSHGFIGRSMINFIFEDPSDFWHGTLPKNCSVIIIETDGENFRIVEKDKIFYEE